MALITTKTTATTTATTYALITAALWLISSVLADQRPKAPIIYTISDEDYQHQPVTSHQRPYSWNNRRLVAKQQQNSELDELERHDMMMAPHNNYHHHHHHHHDSSGYGSSEPKHDLGDLSLLYSHAPVSKISSSSSNRWPMVATAANNGASIRRRAQGTKGGPTSSNKGTKSGRRPPAGTANRHGPRHGPDNHKPKSRPEAHYPPTFEATNGDSSPPSSRSPGNGTSAKRGQASRKNLVCYYGTWAVYRPDAGKYPVENIDPFLCTHIIYGFTGLSYDNMIKPLDPWNDLEDNYGKGAMKRFTNLKRINPDLKTLVAIGGWNEGSIKYSKMASEPEARARFVESVVQFLAKYNFDGLDLDWEYPGSRGGSSYDKQNFVRLLRELKEAFAPHNYLLTAAVSAGKWFIDPAYDIPQVSKYLDLINLMAYDYHGGWETKTGMNAPLFASAKHDLGKDETLLNVNWSVNYWLQQGASREKIMLGVGSYGRSFTLDKANVNGINAPASQKGQAGPYTREPGSLGYNEICEAFKRQPNAWTIVRDPDYLAPYAYNDRQWVGYDDQESLALKAQYAKSMGLGGMMMWSIETDDFHGGCHNEKYPLLNTIRRVLDGPGDGQFVRPPTPTGTTTRRPLTSGRPTSTSTTTTRRPTTTTTGVTSTTPGREVEDEPISSTISPATGRPASGTSRRPSATGRPTAGTSRRPNRTTSRRPTVIQPTSTTTTTTTTTTQRPSVVQPSQDFVCQADGMFADPRNCRKFIRCVSAGGVQFVMYHFDCAPGTAFNEQQQYCDHIYNVPRCNNQLKQVASSLERENNDLRPGEPPIGGYPNQLLWNKYYPGYFSHKFTVHHLW